MSTPSRLTGTFRITKIDGQNYTGTPIPVDNDSFTITGEYAAFDAALNADYYVLCWLMDEDGMQELSREQEQPQNGGTWTCTYEANSLPETAPALVVARWLDETGQHPSGAPDDTTAMVVRQSAGKA
jgi:hypothetical protein